MATTAGRTSSAMLAQSGVPATAGADAGWEVTAGARAGEVLDPPARSAVPTDAKLAPSRPAAHTAGQIRRWRRRRGCTGAGGANGVGVNAAGVSVACGGGAWPALGPAGGAPHPDPGAPVV